MPVLGMYLTDMSPNPFFALQQIYQVLYSRLQIELAVRIMLSLRGATKVDEIVFWNTIVQRC